jgi:tetratricopeptide (TPR) repeat protein
LERLLRENQELRHQEDLARAVAQLAHAREAAGDWKKTVVDYDRAVNCFEAALAGSDQPQTSKLSEELGRVANTLAWILATHPRPDLRDSNKALKLAQRACEITIFEKWEYLDTLAAAHARHGDFAKACELQQKAIKLAPMGAQVSLTNRLATYERSEPFTEGDSS